MPFVFKIGKTYTYRQDTHKYECLFVSPNGNAVMKQTLSGKELFISGPYAPSHNTWEEYVEPRREFFNAYRDTIGNTEYVGPCESRKISDERNNIYYCGGRYGVLELIHHSDTKVESIFHLTKKE